MCGVVVHHGVDNVQRKTVEQDLAHSSFMMLPLTMFILFLAYNYQKVNSSVQFSFACMKYTVENRLLVCGSPRAGLKFITVPLSYSTGCRRASGARFAKGPKLNVS